MQHDTASSSHPDHFAKQTLHIRWNFGMDRGIACIMVQTTYRSSNNGEPAKVSSGIMDRLLFIFILRDNQETEKETNVFFLLQCL